MPDQSRFFKDADGHWWCKRADEKHWPAASAICIGCAREFGYRPRLHHAPPQYCTKECGRKHAEDRWYKDEGGTWWYTQADGNRTLGKERLCGNCGKTFHFMPSKTGPRYPALYCSRLCANKADKPRRRLRGPESPHWRGGRATARGYVLIRVHHEEGYGKDYVPEHRYVMEKYLGRRLGQQETIHHRNGDKTDNRIENLELHVGRHCKGATEKHCPTCHCFDIRGDV